MKNYILSIVIAAIICSLSSALLNEQKAIGKLVKLLSGILMTVTLLNPLKTVTFKNISIYFDNISNEAQAYANEGKISSQYDTAAIIKERTEAYILEKANAMNLDISLEVHLDENNSIPSSVTISGELAPYEKSVLSDYIKETLGISEEHQQWK